MIRYFKAATLAVLFALGMAAIAAHARPPTVSNSPPPRVVKRKSKTKK